MSKLRGPILARILKGITFKGAVRLAAAGIILIAIGFLLDEIHTSEGQARFFSNLAKGMSFDLSEGAFTPLLLSPVGPYDKRLGYAFLPDITRRLEERGFRIIRQAKVSESMHWLREWGIFPAYDEKITAGLKILDRNGEIISFRPYPRRVFSTFSEIPPLIVKILLFIENRELSDQKQPFLNPAVEWDRLAKAAVDKMVQIFFPEHKTEGGSTLATQIEKFRHSPGGVTFSAGDKLFQIVSASLRAYLHGKNTLAARQEIILSYVNSVPLAARPGFGAIIGLGDGLWTWYGADFRKAMALLRDGGLNSDKGSSRDKSLALKQVLSLFLAQRRPTYYLLKDPESLNRKCEKYLRLLGKEGIISRELMALALDAPLLLQSGALPSPPLSFVERKATNAVRTRLTSLSGIHRLYDIDRLDLTVKSTLDLRTQNAVTEELLKLRDPQWVSKMGLIGSRLLNKRGLSKVIYSFVLCEKTLNGNVLRVQTDTYDEPFDINEGVKLDLGSTAKLRTLITYLEIVASLHDSYAGLSRKELLQVEIEPEDRLKKWAVSYLMGTGAHSLPAMLDAAMDRTYPANPYQTFFTGGGVHTFVNFDKEENFRVYSVRQGFKHSVNLVFIRLMQDIVNTYLFREHGAYRKLLHTPGYPERRAYLEKFADYEGSKFIRMFFHKYAFDGIYRDQILEKLAQSIEAEPNRLAAAYMFIAPDCGIEALRTFLKRRLPDANLSAGTLLGIYEKYSSKKWTLPDLGYIACVHPLELWVAAYLCRHPEAGLEEVLKESAQVRQDVYRWLFRTHDRRAQSTRIQTLLEIEAFAEIHEGWKRLGYPFDHLVPSYATAIGASGDRPAALAELMGIIINNGVCLPTYRVEDLHFAQNTPYELMLRKRAPQGEQVLRPEIAQVVKNALYDVVEGGTGILARHAIQRADGTEIRIGGKTGTGDDRYETYGTHGRLISSKIMNRTAVFAFFIQDRFFGVLTAFVPASEAEQYSFTSSLPVAILKALAPQLMPLADAADSTFLLPSNEPGISPKDLHLTNPPDRNAGQPTTGERS
jgi:membrane peptidoglycan carboxypeptidase